MGIIIVPSYRAVVRIEHIAWKRVKTVSTCLLLLSESWRQPLVTMGEKARKSQEASISLVQLVAILHLLSLFPFVFLGSLPSHMLTHPPTSPVISHGIQQSASHSWCPLIRPCLWETEAIFIFYFCPVYFPSATSVSHPHCPLEHLSWGQLPRHWHSSVWAVGVAGLHLSCASLFLWAQRAPVSLHHPMALGTSGSKDRFRKENDNDTMWKP